MLTSINTWLAGFFACAALHYAIHWWSSRSERVLLVFSFQCLTYTAFCLAIVAYFGARTVPAAQATLDRFVSIGVIAHAVSLELYACLGDRRARVYRVALTGVLLFLALLNQWSPLRGTVLELQTLELPGGATSVLPIRTPPGASLVALYVAVLLVYVYGLAIVPGIWRRDRAGAVLLTSASAAILAGTVLGFLVDFAHVRAPYAGAWPHAIFVLCVGLVLSREYAARGARVIATQRQFQAAFEHTPIGKAVLGLDGRFLAVNSALCRMLGRTAEQLPARRLGDFTHPEDMKEPQLGRLRDEPAYIVETRLLRSDGEAVWVLLAVSAVPDDRGQPVQLIAQMQDVTELRAHRERLRELVLTRTRELHEAKDAAERANQAKSQFLAHISHEIRTPLHVIHAHAQSLERDPALGAAQRAKIGIVCSSGKHLQALISDVLEMSKIEAGRPELVESAFDPGATLVEVERMFAAEASSKGIELMVRADPGLPRWVLGDGAKVKQILINLASNALKFTSRGSIRLQAASTRLDSGSVLVEVAVADTGIGMAPADCARIFEPFEQLDAGKLAGGTGLGLAISLAHARLMNGDLRVVSTLGAGSTFTLTYVAKPLSADEMPAIPEEASVVERDGAQRKVLIVDDVALNRDLLSEFLAGHGFQTRTAADGADAVSLHAEWRPDLVLIDLRMRGMGGLEAIRQMRDSKSSAAIGALSASALDEDERNALAFGANFFMRKPYDYTELLEHISRVLGAPLPLDSGHGQ